VLYCDAAAGVAAAAAMLPYQRKAFYQFQLAYTSHARQRLQQTSHDSFKSTRLSTTYITLYSPFIGPFPGSAGLGDGLRTGGLIKIKKSLPENRWKLDALRGAQPTIIHTH